tara:strand:+ start:3312 stop:3437 length:126 start_codon:yes stop_codon:yes gene_type:complete
MVVASAEKEIENIRDGLQQCQITKPGKRPLQKSGHQALPEA